MNTPDKSKVLTPAEVRRIPRKELPSTAKLLYEVLYLFWHKEGQWVGRCTAGAGALAKEIGEDDTQKLYRRTLPELEKAGLIRIEKASGKRNIYAAVEQDRKAETSVKNNTSVKNDTSVKNNTSTSVKNDTSTSVKNDTRKTYKTKKDKITPIPPKGEYEDFVKNVIEYLNEKTGKHYRPTKAHQRHIKARIEEKYTLEDFKRVIDVKAQQWRGTERETYLRPETLFGTKFDSYLNEVPSAPVKTISPEDEELAKQIEAERAAQYAKERKERGTL